MCWYVLAMRYGSTTLKTAVVIIVAGHMADRLAGSAADQTTDHGRHGRQQKPEERSEGPDPDGRCDLRRIYIGGVDATLLDALQDADLPDNITQGAEDLPETQG